MATRFKTFFKISLELGYVLFCTSQMDFLRKVGIWLDKETICSVVGISSAQLQTGEVA